ncbi:hypothetical protein [Streptomyces canus]|uniref:hypothetical protein n=1 Tax=Streptomyces canus TaxID=58343 RepID=UPI00037923DA|nr:hypothetical protein [Streptomyces canus]
MTAAPERGGAYRLIAEQRRHQPDVLRLARSLCLAAQAEPYFLRGARLRFAPDSSTGLEARLCFSPLVEAADSSALVLYPEVSAELRRQLYDHDPDLLGSVRDFTRAAHRCAPPLVRGFEELLWSATVGPPLSEAGIERILTPLFRQVLAEGVTGAEAGRWILRFLPRLPEAVRESLPAWRLQVMAAERLGMEPPRALVTRADADEIRTVRALVHTEVDIGVRAVADGLVLSRPPERGALVCGASGAGRVRLRLRGALPGARWHELDLHEGEHTALNVSVAAEARTDGTLLAAQAELGGTLLCARAGHRAAAATTADGRTMLRIDDGESVLPVELPDQPRLLAVADAGPAATAVVSGKGLHVVTTAVDGTADAVLHPLSVQPTAVGWSRTAERGVLCLAAGDEVLLVGDGDPDRILRALPHPAPVVRLWCSVRAGLVAAADASGGVTVHRLASDRDSEVGRWRPGAGVTALCGDPWSGAVVWGAADGRVYGVGGGAVGAVSPTDAGSGSGSDPASEYGSASGSAPGAVEVLGVLPAPASSLALLPEAGLVVAADGGDRLLRLPWPGGGTADAVPMPFRVREVHPAAGGLLLVSGHGGEVEIRAEDGRSQLLTPGPVPSPPDETEPDWLRDSVGVVLPARNAVLPPGIRRWGIGHVCLPAALPPDSAEFAALLTRARELGLRVLAELAPPGEDAPYGELLRRAYDLLEEPIDGLRLSDPHQWPAPLLTRLRHLLDAYPRTAIVTTATHLTRSDSPFGTGHLSLGPPPEPANAPEPSPESEPHPESATPAAPLPPYRPWVLPDGLSRPRAGLLLALPGCHEVPASVLAPDGRSVSTLRPLLAARAGQLALRHGGVERVPTGVAGVTAVRRDHAGQTVLCLTSTARVPVTARVALPEATAGTELVEIAHDPPDSSGPPDHPPTAPARILRPASDGLVTVEIDVGGTRWFRVRADTHPPPDEPEPMDPFAPTAR